MSREPKPEHGRRIDQIFADFNESWMKYWNAYVELQNQLYESVKAAREVSWLAGTDPAKLSAINAAQRDLFASMPRRMDYEPLGQVSLDLDSAVNKIDQLQTALAVEKAKIKKLEEAIEVLEKRAQVSRDELVSAQR